VKHCNSRYFCKGATAALPFIPHNYLVRGRSRLHLGLEDIERIAIAAYIEELGADIAKPSVKQHLAANRRCSIIY